MFTLLSLWTKSTELQNFLIKTIQEDEWIFFVWMEITKFEKLKTMLGSGVVSGIMKKKERMMGTIFFSIALCIVVNLII